MIKESIIRRLKVRRNAVKVAKNTSCNATDLFVKLCEKQLAVQCIKEYRFYKPRKWRFDYAFPKYKIALEVEGGVWTQGRHTNPKGFLGDMNKYNTATLLGWRLFRTTPKKLLSSNTIQLIRSAIGGAFVQNFTQEEPTSDNERCFW